MNKTAKAFSFVLIACIMLVGFVACGNAITRISVKAGTLETKVVIGSSIDTSNLVLIVEYENGDKQEVAKNDEMKFSSVDTSTLGQKDLIITYKEKSVTIKIQVVNAGEEDYTITAVAESKIVTHYENIKASNPLDENSFIVNNDTYKVGDDNAFVLFPVILARDSQGATISVTDNVTMDMKVFMKNESGEYEQLVDNLSTYVTLDTKKASFDFTENAIGKEFRLEVVPLEWLSKDPAVVKESTSVLEVEVVDAWNAYDEIDLSRIYNVSGNYRNSTIGTTIKTSWDNFKEEHGISNDNINGIVLHKDMKLEKEDLAAGLFESDGTLKNWVSIYARDVKSTDTFSIHGNYFGIDASSLPTTTVETNKMSHSSLFGFGGDNYNQTKNIQGNTIVENLNFLGTAGRSQGGDEESTENPAGGFMLFHNSQESLILDNIVARKFQTMVVGMYNTNTTYDNKVIINCSKMYDSFSTMLYMFGLKNTLVRQCIMKNSGGPLIIAADCDPDNAESLTYSNIEIRDSELENFVAGTEAWFGLNSAAPIVTRIKQLNQPFLDSGKGKSFLKDNNLIDLQTLIISGEDNPLLNGYPVKGMVTYTISTNNLGTSLESIDSEEIKVVNVVNPTNETLQYYYNQLNSLVHTKEIPFFQSSDQFIKNPAPKVFISKNENGMYFADITTGGTSLDINNNLDFFKGDLCNLYYNGASIGLSVGYIDIK